MNLSEIRDAVVQAGNAGKLQDSSVKNILELLAQSGLQDWERDSVGELVESEHWTELNDRFYKHLTFGTAGLRGRTIGKIVTSAEQGTPDRSAETLNDRPLHPAVGTNMMNEANVIRATRGVARYLKKQIAGEQLKFVIAHDTRHFSRKFAERTAEVIAEAGGLAYLFESERSTPELSFAIRYLGAHAGVVITASHNPPHDNGYKVYFKDGAQIIEPHAGAIIKEVQSLAVASPQEGGGMVAIGEEIDRAYINTLSELVIEPNTVVGQKSNIKIVYTPIHGTGSKVIPKLLEQFEITCTMPPAQALPDGRFPTVASPNPENPEALAQAVELAKHEKADLVMATDPDADRMGVAVRNRSGEYEMLTGNQIGSILAHYRLERFFARGILNKENASRAAIIKTFVTTDLQKAIAEDFGVKCVDTLTGFKYIGAKLADYEREAGGRGNAPAERWRASRLEKSTFFVFGGEESYGYLGSDDVRDKDANGAVLMLAEAGAFAMSKGITLLEYLDNIYLKYGFYWEKLGTLTFEGAEGAEKIQRLLRSYKEKPPQLWHDRKVENIQNFSEEKIKDVDGKLIPSELMFIFHLEGSFRVAVRASGTEPKIKYYFFGKADASGAAELGKAKAALKTALEELWAFTRDDVESRLGL